MENSRKRSKALGVQLSNAEVQATRLRLEQEIERTEREIAALRKNPSTSTGQEAAIVINV
jgi:hypothetical protein